MPVGGRVARELGGYPVVIRASGAAGAAAPAAPISSGKAAFSCRLEAPSMVGHTMETLEIIVIPLILAGGLLLGAIWTTLTVRWLRSTEPLR